MVAPALLLMAGLFVFPVLYALNVSLRDAQYGNLGDFVGLANYAKVISMPQFRHALTVTTKFTVLCLLLEFPLGLLLAMAANRATKWVTFARGLLLIPLVLPVPVMAMMWYYIYEPTSGVLPSLLRLIGFVRGTGQVSLLGNPATALYAVIAVQTSAASIWLMLLILAALQSIPVELYEAAALDGAGRLTTFRQITLPLIMPTLTFLFLTQAMGHVSEFGLVWVLTKGGPIHATEVLGIVMWQELTQRANLATSTAISFFIFCIILVFGIFYGAMLLKRSPYREENR
jgi:ABC-type sugar transport system permease subunit